jgi:hypothetical protein
MLEIVETSELSSSHDKSTNEIAPLTVAFAQTCEAVLIEARPLVREAIEVQSVGDTPVLNLSLNELIQQQQQLTVLAPNSVDSSESPRHVHGLPEALPIFVNPPEQHPEVSSPFVGGEVDPVPSQEQNVSFPSFDLTPCATPPMRALTPTSIVEDDVIMLPQCHGTSEHNLGNRERHATPGTLKKMRYVPEFASLIYCIQASTSCGQKIYPEGGFGTICLPSKQVKNSGVEMNEI